jgi:metal-dependent amidase/aminoacylase/carboxypeptidase family protein
MMGCCGRVIGDSQLLAAVEAHEGVLRSVVAFVHAHPELGHEEFACSAHVAEALRAVGFEVELGIASMPTAFRATLRGARPGRSVAIVALYDAVPAVAADGSIVPTHSCGHGPIAGSVVAAAAALAAHREELAGSVNVVGCPSDEIHAPGSVARGGGKLLTVEAGVWDDVDVALYCHPEFLDTVNLRSLWMQRHRLAVSGARSLRVEAVQEPLDALAALVAAVRSRPPDSVLLEQARLDGDVEERTGLYLEASVLLFASGEDELHELAAWLREAVPSQGWSAGSVVRGVRPDPAVTAAVRDAFAAAGRTGFIDDPPALPFATDFGNVSWRVPAALIGVGRDGGWSFHTSEGAVQFASEDGIEAALVSAKVLALATARLTEP